MDTPLNCFPYGVGHGSEGVCLLVRMGHHRILLDCGLQDVSLLTQAKTPPMDVILCSHAHSDHARGLWQLHQAFPQIPIYASEVTTQLLPLNWLNSGNSRLRQGDTILDSVMDSGRDADKSLGIDALGDSRRKEGAEPGVNFCTALPWRSPIEILSGLVVELFPAGHLPGAALISLTYTPPEPPQNLPFAALAEGLRPYSLFYTGDFFLSHSRLVEGLDLQSVRGVQPDVLILEGTYGTARHPHRRQQENLLVEQMSQVLSGGQSILLPVPMLGIGQEILMLLRSHHQFTGRKVDIWVDRSVAAGCDAYLEILPHLPSTVQNFARHQPLFWDDRVLPRVRRFTTDLPVSEQPCILLVDHRSNWSHYYQAAPDSWVLFAPEGSSQEFPADLSIVNYLLAQHGDRQGTTQLIHNLRPQHVVFVHGSSTYLTDLACLEELQSRYQLHCPSNGILVDLPVGETFIQPVVPVQPNYEGELNELGTIVTITLPEAIAADPRWQRFADTGLVEARWQGEELVLKGLSARELMQQNPHPILAEVPCCRNCQYLRNQRCTNAHSPLYRFKVPPEGYCPSFLQVD